MDTWEELFFVDYVGPSQKLIREGIESDVASSYLAQWQQKIKLCRKLGNVELMIEEQLPFANDPDCTHGEFIVGERGLGDCLEIPWIALTFDDEDIELSQQSRQILASHGRTNPLEISRSRLLREVEKAFGVKSGGDTLAYQFVFAATARLAVTTMKGFTASFDILGRDAAAVNSFADRWEMVRHLYDARMMERLWQV